MLKLEGDFVPTASEKVRPPSLSLSLSRSLRGSRRRPATRSRPATSRSSRSGSCTSSTSRPTRSTRRCTSATLWRRRARPTRSGCTSCATSTSCARTSFCARLCERASELTSCTTAGGHQAHHGPRRAERDGAALGAEHALHGARQRPPAAAPLHAVRHRGAVAAAPAAPDGPDAVDHARALPRAQGREGVCRRREGV